MGVGDKVLGTSVVEGLADKGLRRRPVAGPRDTQNDSSVLAKDGGQTQFQDEELSALHTPHGGREDESDRLHRCSKSRGANPTML